MLPTGILQIAKQRDLLQRQNASPFLKVEIKKPYLTDTLNSILFLRSLDMKISLMAVMPNKTLKDAWAGTVPWALPTEQLNSTLCISDWNKTTSLSWIYQLVQRQGLVQELTCSKDQMICLQHHHHQSLPSCHRVLLFFHFHHLLFHCKREMISSTLQTEV